MAEGAAGTDWTDGEIDLIVADYFDMLRLERAGQPYIKANRNRALQALVGRSHGSIEFKHRNISAILRKLGSDWVQGYRPAENYQRALLKGIERYLDSWSDALAPAPEPVMGMAEAGQLFIGPPPVLAADAAEPQLLKHLVRKFDPAARDARNRALGKLGEELVFHSERRRLTAAGRADLARSVRWIAEEDGDGAGYDVLSFDMSGRERLLEVKTTVGHETTPFYLTENERLLSVERPEHFRLLRVHDFNRAPRAFELVPPLESRVMLRPTVYRASFG